MVEQGCLLSSCTGNPGTEGSNPSLSAKVTQASLPVILLVRMGLEDRLPSSHPGLEGQPPLLHPSLSCPGKSIPAWPPFASFMVSGCGVLCVRTSTFVPRTSEFELPAPGSVCTSVDQSPREAGREDGLPGRH